MAGSGGNAGFRVAVVVAQAETFGDAHVGDSLCRLLSSDLAYDATLELRAHKGQPHPDLLY